MLTAGAMDGIGSLYAFCPVRGHHVGGVFSAHIEDESAERELQDQGM
jgi:hypothetical protein